MALPRPRAGWMVGGVAVVALILGCSGGVPTGKPTSNHQACERYSDHLNSLSPCVGLIYDSDNLCEGIDLVPVDLIPTYDCLVANTRCEGDQPILDTQSCQLPLVTLDGPVAVTELPEGSR